MFTTQHKQSRHGSTKVPSTMGRATSILASAALLVLSLTPGSSAFQAASRSRRISTAFYVGQSSQTHHQRTRPARPDSATRLKYRDSLDEEGSSTTAFQPKGWWNKIRTPYASIDPAAQEADSRQAVVDDYLEFLDRRYNRLHAEDDHNNSERRRPEQIKFSAWKWLTQGSDDDDEDGSSTQGQKQEPSTLPEGRQADQENALYVLGVAGLASQKLLQKHQLSVPEQPQALKQAEAQALTVETTTQPKASPTVAASKLAYLLRRVSLQRKTLLRYQTQKMQALAKLGIKTVKAGPGKAVRKMLQLGGGGKNVAVTVTLVSAMLFFVIGPLTKAIVSEGAQHA